MKALQLIAELRLLVSELGDETEVEVAVAEDYGYVWHAEIEPNAVRGTNPRPERPGKIQIRI